MSKNDKAPWAPQEGAEREDLKEEACDFVPSGTSTGQPLPADRKPYGGKVGPAVEPQLGKGERNDWGHQGYMVQPLTGGFAYPSSQTMLRRDLYELNEKDNWDPKEALPPRIKKSDTSS